MGREKGEGAASWFTVEIDRKKFTPNHAAALVNERRRHGTTNRCQDVFNSDEEYAVDMFGSMTTSRHCLLQTYGQRR